MPVTSKARKTNSSSTKSGRNVTERRPKWPASEKTTAQRIRAKASINKGNTPRNSGKSMHSKSKTVQAQKSGQALKRLDAGVRTSNKAASAKLASKSGRNSTERLKSKVVGVQKSPTKAITGGFIRSGAAAGDVKPMNRHQGPFRP